MVFVFPETGKCVTNVTKLPWIIATGRDNVTNVTTPRPSPQGVTRDKRDKRTRLLIFFGNIF